METAEQPAADGEQPLTAITEIKKSVEVLQGFAEEWNRFRSQVEECWKVDTQVFLKLADYMEKTDTALQQLSDRVAKLELEHQ